ncbi:DinB family protein [Pedobacter sp. HMF7647]|uniref:DinB family protein n=1 Tax=Hufsiella arboris TaxID=2695275 RepID=A0A7K1Y7X3_9SPHI|nr:DinB family protein [Hufsiella arboris]MXV50682.1 DinB family protein [Hufsiella arboris]
MSQIEIFLKELEQEAVTSRKMLERVPMDKADWKPHEKSMTLGRLSNHVAELPGWIEMALTTNELDFQNNQYEPQVNKTNEDLMRYFETTLEKGRAALAVARESELGKNWTLRNGEEIYSTSTKAEVIRMSLNQIVHHRAQLGVFLRLLDIPIPGSYGPSADEMEFSQS